jgi:hypothetical protein
MDLGLACFSIYDTYAKALPVFFFGSSLGFLFAYAVFSFGPFLEGKKIVPCSEGSPQAPIKEVSSAVMRQANCAGDAELVVYQGLSRDGDIEPQPQAKHSDCHLPWGG